MSAPFAIEARALTVTLGGKPILDQLTLGFRSGQVSAIVGPNGAGKTTLLKALLRLLTQDSGQIFLQGEDISERKPHRLVGGVSYLEQGHNIYWPLKVEALVGLSLAPEQSLDAALERTAVTDFREQSALTLSGGERARVLLARVLAAQAPVILADEPTLSLDPRHQIAILECFRQEAERGVAVVLVMHDLLMAEKYADRIVVLANGRVHADVAAADGLDDQSLADVFAIKRADLA